MPATRRNGREERRKTTTTQSKPEASEINSRRERRGAECLGRAVCK